jgi:hypothetical protein
LFFSLIIIGVINSSATGKQAHTTSMGGKEKYIYHFCRKICSEQAKKLDGGMESKAGLVGVS